MPSRAVFCTSRHGANPFRISSAGNAVQDLPAQLTRLQVVTRPIDNPDQPPAAGGIGRAAAETPEHALIAPFEQTVLR